MPRPRTINPNGKVRTASVQLAEETYLRLRQEAANRGVTLSAIMREKLEARS